MPYRAPLADLRFLMRHVVGFDRVCATARFAEAGLDTAEAVLAEAARLAESVIAPVNRAGDVQPARLENGVVRTSPGFAAAYGALAAGGWIGLSADPAHGGMGLPLTIATAVNEMLSGACLALQINTLLTMGQIEALEQHGSAALRAYALPKLVTGEWNGTMNLTEPQAGSDLGALAARADDLGGGIFAISGQKIYISWGEADFLPNTCHLVLARLPDAAPGTAGISLFLVPRLWTDGVRNGVSVLRLEHKLGLHGSPTCVMEYDRAKGWLVGAPHKGLAAMFTMMNNARLGVGVQGVGVAEAALQQALDHAGTRVQGRTALGRGPIGDHADVRRMLAEARAEVFAARAIALSCAVALDMGRATGGAEWQARAALLTPIAKAYGTEVGIAVAGQNVQVHGGMGFIEETGAAQLLRDVRVTAIYEGTNGIQAMDLVGRKMADGGAAAFALIDEIQADAGAARGLLPDLAAEVWQAAEALRHGTDGLLAAGMTDRFAGAVPYLRAFARVLGGHLHLRAAVAEGRDGPRRALARVMIGRLLPEHVALLAQASAGAGALFALGLDDLGAGVAA
ncbi:MAG: hypothetical protein RIT14_1101 [Pseudomonadota bacterium]